MDRLARSGILPTVNLGLLAILLMAGAAGHARWSTADAAEVGYRPRVEAQRRGPRAPVIPEGLIAGFEDGEMSATFGAGWQVATDSSAGGASVVEVTVVEGGADDSNMSLRVVGTIVPRPGEPAWAGPVFSPGRQQFARANLSAYEGISFWLRGDGAAMSVSIFSLSLRDSPSTLSLPTTDAWTEHRVAFPDFDMVDAAGINAISFSGVEPGDFEFQIDELRVW